MKKILAIDPGSEQSAYICFYNGAPTEFSILPNEQLLHIIPQFTADDMAIEMVACYGMPVGKTVFDTCIWIGRFIQRWDKPFKLIYRKDVKIYLCNSMRAKDSNIRQALIDRFGETRETAIGTKKNPGPLYGIKKDLWSALAIAVTYCANYEDLKGK